MTSWARSRAPSRPMMRLTCVFTVSGLRCSTSAISALLRPRATRVSTSRSRADSSPSCSAMASPVAGAASGSRRARAMIRAVGPGESSASPAATVRIPSSSSAGRVSLTRKPLAPARSAAMTWSSVSYVVSTRTLTPARSLSAAISRVASIPSRSGMRISMTITSTPTVRASATASRPVRASPTTSMSREAPTSIANAPRTRAWSSARSTRIDGDRSSFTVRPPGPRAAGGRR
jgi:hypothetical protein